MLFLQLIFVILDLHQKLVLEILASFIIHATLQRLLIIGQANFLSQAEVEV
jgi:hypothetical protein